MSTRKYCTEHNSIIYGPPQLERNIVCSLIYSCKRLVYTAHLRGVLPSEINVLAKILVCWAWSQFSLSLKVLSFNLARFSTWGNTNKAVQHSSVKYLHHLVYDLQIYMVGNFLAAYPSDRICRNSVVFCCNNCFIFFISLHYNMVDIPVRDEETDCQSYSNSIYSTE